MKMKTSSAKTQSQFVRWFETLNNHDVPLVGGKNASLGEMVSTLKSTGIRIPDGFATTADAYWHFVEANHLKEKIQSLLSELESGAKSLEETGREVRRLFLRSHFPEEIAREIR